MTRAKTRSSAATEVDAHLAEVDAAAGTDRRLRTVSLHVPPGQHLAGHIVADETLTGFQRSGEYYHDLGQACEKVKHLSAEELRELHHKAHRDTCVCGRDAVGRHSDSCHELVWCHADDSSVSCQLAGDPPVRPQRWGGLYATVVIAMRIRLPHTVSADEADQYLTDRIQINVLEDETDMFDPPRELGTEIVISDVTDRAAV